MKKLFYSVAVMASAIFAGCNPLAEIDNEFQELPSGAVSSDYSVTAEDYAMFSEGMEFFNPNVPAETSIPTVLGVRAQNAGPGSIIAVSYKEQSVLVGEDAAATYVMDDVDYEKINGPGAYANFGSDDPSQLPIFLKNFVEAKPGAIQIVEFEFYGTLDAYHEYEFNGTEWTRTAKVTSGFDVENAYEITDADYELVGNSYGSFSDYQAEGSVPTILAERFPAAVSGELKSVKFAHYRGFPIPLKQVYQFDGMNWAKPEEASVEYDWNAGEWTISYVLEKTSKFEKVEGAWAMIKAIEYTLTAEDYATISAYDPNNSDVAGIEGYGNFGWYLFKEGTYKGEEVANVFNALMIDFMNEKFSDVEEGQMYIISFEKYDNGRKTDKIRLMKTADSWEVAE